jgi:ribosomal protein S27AE
MFRGKRDRLLERLSLGSRFCPECKTASLYLAEKKPVRISCQHCKGEWEVKDDGYTLRRMDFSNITPLYLESEG